MAVFTYDPAAIIITVGGVPISGFSDSTFLEIARTDPTFNTVVGADGYVTRGKTNNLSGTMTITLKQSSPSNDVLSGFAILDEATSTGIFPVLVKDLSGTSIYFSAQAWVQQISNATYAKEISDNQWVLALADIDMFVGGNSETP